MTSPQDVTSDRVRIERTFTAPPALVWTLWTDPDHVAAWYGPDGSRVRVVRHDLYVGGTRLLSMEVDTPNGTRTMWFTGTFLEVVEDQRLVYTDAMADEHGTVLDPAELGMPAGHPVVTEVQIDLFATAEGTRLVLTHLGIPAGSPGETGWTMALDKLDKALAVG
jgi:uncharacterized protein YndB with AHSA1/START domain